MLLSCVSHGFTIPKPHQTASSIRGGGENEDLDAYIEALIAGVSDPEDDDQGMRGGGEEPMLENDEEEVDNDDVEGVAVATDAVEKSSEKKEDPVVVAAQVEKEDNVDHARDDEATSVRPRTRRPNGLYRFLLNQGRIGHYVVLFLVWLVEFVTTYIPPLANAVSAVWIAIFGVAPVVMEQHKAAAAPGVRGKANKNQAGFADNRAGRGKERKKAAQKEDKDAAAQLRRLGNVNEARYKLLSMDFMKKHGLGPYSTTSSSLSTIVEENEEAGVEEVDEDEDVDWVVEALTKEEDTVKPSSSKKRKKKKVNMSSSVGVSTKGVSVGVEFSIGGSSSSSSKRRRKRKTSKLIEAATSSRESSTKVAGPRVSDKEGGMLGRLRDFSTNNLVSRSLMGAYPGDALPPSQAASSTGVLELARKYGYGDWSDDEDEEGMGRKRRRKRRKVTSSGGSSRKSSSSSSRSSSSKRRKSRKSSSSNLSVEFSTSSTSRRRPSVSPSLKKLSDPSSKRVRLPLERLKEKDDALNGD